MKIYCVETWSDEMRYSPWDGGRSHETHVAHICETFEQAQEFCKDNPTYNGTADDVEGFYPWHWEIIERDTEDSEYFKKRVVTPDVVCNDDEGEECKCSGKCDECVCDDEGEDEETVCCEEEKCNCGTASSYISQCMNEAFDYSDHSNAFNKWCEYFQSTSDHFVEPLPDEAWNGAVETICAYVTNMLCNDFSYEKAKEKAEKIRRFRCL